MVPAVVVKPNHPNCESLPCTLRLCLVFTGLSSLTLFTNPIIASQLKSSATQHGPGKSPPPYPCLSAGDGDWASNTGFNKPHKRLALVAIVFFVMTLSIAVTLVLLGVLHFGVSNRAGGPWIYAVNMTSMESPQSKWADGERSLHRWSGRHALFKGKGHKGGMQASQPAAGSEQSARTTATRLMLKPKSPEAIKAQDVFAFNSSSSDAAYLSKIWPTVFILGVQKGGTTALAHFLFAHPLFCNNTGGKESHFFNPRNFRKSPQAHKNAMDYFRVTGVDPKCSRAVRAADWEKASTGEGPPILNGRVHKQGRHLDATPLLGWGKAHQQMFASTPSALHPHLKFIVLLREPLSRDLSMYNHVRAIKAKWGFCPETEPARRAHEGYRRFLAEKVKCSQPGAGCSACMQRRIQHGHYAAPLKKWFSLFGREQFFILQSDALDSRQAGKDGVAAVLRKLGGFLGLPAGDYDWERLVSGGYERIHTASGYLGQAKSRMQELTPEDCRAGAAIYATWNSELYRLLESTHSKAPAGQPSFQKFQDPCRKIAPTYSDAGRSRTHREVAVSALR